MSKTSYTLIAIMLIALIYMGAVRGYDFYQRKVSEWQEERANENPFTFQNVPLSLAAPQPEPVGTPVSFDSIQHEVYLEDASLSQENLDKQAKQTIRSIIDDYKDTPELKDFNKDLQAITNDKNSSFEQLSSADLTQIIQNNPQIKEIVSKHMQDPNFAKIVQQILSNPQFAQSVQQLQKTKQNN